MASSLGSSALVGAALLGLGLSFGYRALSGGRGNHDCSNNGNGNNNFPAQHDATQFRKAKLISSKDAGGGAAKVLKFRYEPGQPGFAPGKPLSHVTIRGKTFDVPPEYPFGLKVERDYTPISATKNEFEILVKRYAASPSSNNSNSNKNSNQADKNNHSFSKYGITSRFLLALEPGKTIEVRGPAASFHVDSSPASSSSASTTASSASASAVAAALENAREAVQQRKFVGMIAAGSGITPMVQLLRQHQQQHHHGANHRRFSVLWSNKTLEDAFYLKELDKLKSRDVTVRLTLTRNAPAGWPQDTGRVSKELLRARMPPPGPECLIIVCGPDDFVQAVAGGKKNSDGKWVGPIGGLLHELDYSSEHVLRL